MQGGEGCDGFFQFEEPARHYSAFTPPHDEGSCLPDTVSKVTSLDNPRGRGLAKLGEGLELFGKLVAQEDLGVSDLPICVCDLEHL